MMQHFAGEYLPSQWYPQLLADGCRERRLLRKMPGGHDLGKGYGDVRPWRPPFHASPAVWKGPISSKRVSSQDPLLWKFGNFGLYNLNFHQILAHKPPNLEIFSSQASKFGNFQFTSSPFQRQIAVRKPHTLEIEKLSAPPGKDDILFNPQLEFYNRWYRWKWSLNFFYAKISQNTISCSSTCFNHYLIHAFLTIECTERRFLFFFLY